MGHLINTSTEPKNSHTEAAASPSVTVTLGGGGHPPGPTTKRRRGKTLPRKTPTPG